MQEPGARPATGEDLIVSAISLAIFVPLELLSWLSHGGGILSVGSAIASIAARASIINIDQNGLLFPMIVMIWLTCLVVCRFFDVGFDLSSRGRSLLPILLMIGGAFLINGMIGERIITQYMSSKGYSRCVAGDWKRGNGKSRVWFANYVRKPGDCRPHGG